MPAFPVVSAGATPKSFRLQSVDPRSLKVLWWGLALLVASCVTLFGLGIYQVAWNASALTRDHEEVVEALKVISTGRALDRALRDAELSQRNIAITGNAGYQASYRSAA